MKILVAAVVFAVIAAALGITYLHERAHRFDIVVAGAGSGGSQENTGDTAFKAYLVDHQTGRVWSVDGVNAQPLIRFECSDIGFDDSPEGCRVGPKKGDSK